MDLQVKKLKVDISTTPRQNFLPSSYRHPEVEANYSFPAVKAEDYENLFQNVLRSVSIFKIWNRRMRFLLECLFGDFEQKHGRYNY